jgi:hypothetical protein
MAAPAKPRKPQLIESKELVEKALRSLRARELGKKNYARADRLLQEIALEIEPGQVIKLGEKNGLTLKDKFSEKDIVWTPCAARRWELEKVELS